MTLSITDRHREKTEEMEALIVDKLKCSSPESKRHQCFCIFIMTAALFLFPLWLLSKAESSLLHTIAILKTKALW